jgi:hypothetical protein
MPNCDFYAAGDDFCSILDFVFAQPGWTLVELASLPDQPLRRVERIPNGMRFTVAGGGFIDGWGFAYSTDETPANAAGNDEYEHLDGGWWIWTDRFRSVCRRYGHARRMPRDADGAGPMVSRPCTAVGHPDSGESLTCVG